MSRSVIFARQILDGFASDSNYGGLYTQGCNFPESGFEGALKYSFSIEIGETYIVYWDGKEYPVIGQDASHIMDGAIALGNGAAFELNGNNEPFALAVIGGVGVSFMSLADTEESHTIAIYHADESVIMPEDTLQFAYNASFGAYANSDFAPEFELEEEKHYTITWGDSKYPRTSFAFTAADGSECIGIGNPLGAGQESNDDPFCIIYDVTHKYMHYAAMDQEASHTIAIYQLADSFGDGAVILPEIPYDGFTNDPDTGMYTVDANADIYSPFFDLLPEEAYTVHWDGAPYSCVSRVVGTEEDGSETVAMGNLSLGGMSGGNENAPFIIVWTVNGSYLAAIDDDSPSHTLAIFKGDMTVDPEEPETPENPEVPEDPEDPETSEGIILKDRNGNDVAYYGIETVTFDTTTEGKQQTYTKGVAVEGLEIPVEFAGGDMILVAAENTLVKSAVIKKPDTLIPENVRNGVAIGGVEGNFIGETEETTVALDLADGDQIVFPPTEGKVLSKVTIQKPETLLPENILKDIVIAGVRGSHEVLPMVYGSGTFTPTSAESTVTVSHQLGMIPDIVFISAINPTVTVNGLRYTVSMSTGLAKAVGADNAQNLKVYAGNAGIMSVGITYGIDVDNPETAIMVHGAGVKTFKVTGASLATFVPNKEHSWAAFCGIVPHSDYFYIRLDVENYTNLIVTGGVPEIQQLEIYANGTLAKTVDYVYGDTFTVDVSDISNDYMPYTFSVKALGETLAEKRPKQYYDTVSNGILAGGTCGDSVRWKLTKDGDMTIFGSGAMTDYTAYTEQPWYSYASAIKTITVENGVTHIGSQSLRATNATRITLPDSVVSLGKSAFYGNTQLTSINLSSSIKTMDIYVLGACTALTSIELPEGLSEIGGSMFYDCTGLTSITIPDSVTKIGEYAFRGCSRLAQINIPAGVTSIERSTFYNCTGLTQITIPENVTNIGPYAFYGCTRLKGITIPDNVTMVDYYAFHTCTSLESVTIGAKVATINYRAFQGCAALTEITIPASVTKIGDNTFLNCSKLTSATFKDTTTWKYYTSETATSGSTISSSSLANTSTAANYLRNTYVSKWWKKT